MPADGGARHSGGRLRPCSGAAVELLHRSEVGLSQRRRAEAAGDRLPALKRLRELLALFHVANDADDHWSSAEAAEIRQRAIQGIRDLIAEQPFVLELFPALESELQTAHQRDISWSIWVALEREIRTLAPSPPAPFPQAGEV